MDPWEITLTEQDEEKTLETMEDDAYADMCLKRARDRTAFLDIVQRRMPVEEDTGWWNFMEPEDWGNGYDCLPETKSSRAEYKANQWADEQTWLEERGGMKEIVCVQRRV